MKNKKHLLISLLVIIIFGVIGLVYSVIDFTAINKTMSYSYEVIQFDYDGASDGLDPNGNSFNPVSFLTDDVIEDALEKSSLNYEVEKVRQYVLMENIVPKNIVNEINAYTSLTKDGDTREITTNDYHPVRYQFVLYHDLDKKLSKTKLNELLDNIVDAYCESFFSTYEKVYNLSNYNAFYTIDNYDYIYQADVLTNKIRILSNGARDLYNEHTEFLVDNKSFNDIALKCEQLISSDVSRIRNIITLNALSKDINRLKDYYNFKIENLNFEKTKYTSDLTNINTQLTNYTKDSTVYVGSGENIVKVESNSSVTYDNLLSRQITISNRIASINKEISDYQSILDDINNAVATEEDYDLVKTYITKLSNEYDVLENTYKTMSEKYNEEYVTNGAISKYNVYYYSSSIISTSFIVRCIKICAPIVLVAMLGVCISYLVREIKRNKENYI